jgi:hypothetical protein
MTEGFLRPEATVLGDDALVPDASTIRPPPNRFTHELTRPTAFVYAVPGMEAPGGELPLGTHVLLVRNDGERAWVLDARGLYLQVPHGSLRLLPPTAKGDTKKRNE